jgi:hypothetical protein
MYTPTPKNTVIPVIVSLATVASILMHDTQIGRAAELAAASERPVFSENSTITLKVTQHIHMDSGLFTGEVFSGKSAQPSAQPRGNDDKKYLAQKRYLSNDVGTDYHVPIT